LAEASVSVVVPCYRSAECVAELARRVALALAPTGRRFELVLVNDASPDGTWAEIARLAASEPFVVGVDLRRNVGQDGAIMAGLHHARGAIAVVMDDDLQHDPADIPRLCAALEGGADVVYAEFERKRQAWWKNLGSWLAGQLAVRVLGKPPEIYLSPYKAIRGDVVAEVVRYRGPFPYLDGILFTVTSRIAQIPAQHHERYAGASNYDLVKSVRVALKLATSFSVLPLRVASIVGAALAVLAFALGAAFLTEALTSGENVPGWASLIVSVLFLGGVQLVGIGLLGEYVGRIFITQNQRPQFVVREVSGRRLPG
jgi:undecaprenyl-phosphate 4-deoxy-4-formamido-L-arabinose transferase